MEDFMLSFKPINADNILETSKFLNIKSAVPLTIPLEPCICGGFL